MLKSSLIRINLIFLLLVLFIPNLTSAETKTFIKEYTYQASEADSKLTSRDNALTHVKRLLAEELGTYLESNTEVKNYQLTKDQIISYTVFYDQIQIINEKWNGKEYWMQAKIDADPEEVVKYLDAVRKDRDQSKQLEELKRKTDDLLKENEQLKKVSKEDQINIALYERNVQEIKANGLIAEATILTKQKKHKAAIEQFTTAIQLYSTSDSKALVYARRGLSYLNLRDYEQAINDCTKAIELNADENMAYRVRGEAYGYLSKYDQSIKDYSKAIELDPRPSDFYSRGRGYMLSGNNEEAIQDFTMAIQLNPKYVLAYKDREAAYEKIGNKVKAETDNQAAANISDVTETVEKADAARWFEKGMELSKKGNHRDSINAFTKAIELNPESAEAYHNRGLRYQSIGDDQQSLVDLKIAAQLGHKNSQDFLRFQNIKW